jgi:hypothetical protein
MTSEIILAFLFLALMVFVYVVIRLYSGIIRHLTTELVNLKAFSMGVPRETHVPPKAVIPKKVDEDFGVLTDEPVLEEEEEDY